MLKKWNFFDIHKVKNEQFKILKCHHRNVRRLRHMVKCANFFFDSIHIFCEHKINCIRQQRFFFISVDDCREKKPQSTHYIIMSSQKNQKTMLLQKASDEEKIACMSIQHFTQKVHNKPFLPLLYFIIMNSKTHIQARS
jgi:hypothetical protein